MLRKFQDIAFRPVDIAWLAAFRMLFGLVMCISMLRFVAYGWIDDFFVRPKFHFKYWGFGWVEPLSGSGMHALFWALAALALAMAAGFVFRASASLFALGFTYLQVIDVATYLNHYYLAALLAWLLAASPAHHAMSVDARLGWCDARDRVPSLWLLIFRFQVGLVYTFAGFAKAHADWLVHAEPLTIWLSSHTDMPLLGALFTERWAPLVASWAGFLFDASIAWLLLSRRLRPFAFVAVIGFHVFTRALFPIGMFPVIMILSAAVFFSPDWPRRMIARAAKWLPRALAPMSEGGAPSKPSLRARTAGLVLAGAYCFAQAALPLRFLAYGGNVLWHEQGMRFSWRVMVREKNGSVTFNVRDRATGRTWEVSPRSYLTRLQEREASAQPDLILQMAHHIRDDFEKRGIGPVEVHADVLVSLNGRPLTRLVDPAVDLSRVSDGVGRAAWILPAPSDPPPRLRPL